MILNTLEIFAWVFAHFGHLLKVGTQILFSLSTVFIMYFDTLTQ